MLIVTIIDIIINLIVAPRFLFCSVVGFTIFYIISSSFPVSDWANTVGFIVVMILMAIGAVWECKASSNSK